MGDIMAQSTPLPFVALNEFALNTVFIMWDIYGGPGTRFLGKILKINSSELARNAS